MSTNTLRLDAASLDLLESARRAVLTTIGPDGRPRPVPICFATVWTPDASALRVYTPIDEKPKRSTDAGRLARTRDIEARPRVAFLVDRWDEDWSRLAWVRLEGTARVLSPVDTAEEPAEADAAEAEEAEREMAFELLRRRYPQYAAQDLEARPLIRIEVTRAVAWAAAAADE